MWLVCNKMNTWWQLEPALHSCSNFRVLHSLPSSIYIIWGNTTINQIQNTERVSSTGTTQSEVYSPWDLLRFSLVQMNVVSEPFLMPIQYSRLLRYCFTWFLISPPIVGLCSIARKPWRRVQNSDASFQVRASSLTNSQQVLVSLVKWRQLLKSTVKDENLHERVISWQQYFNCPSNVPSCSEESLDRTPGLPQQTKTCTLRNNYCTRFGPHEVDIAYFLLR